MNPQEWWNEWNRGLNEANRVRDLAREASNRDLESKRQAEREVEHLRAENQRLLRILASVWDLIQQGIRPTRAMFEGSVDNYGKET